MEVMAGYDDSASSACASPKRRRIDRRDEAEHHEGGGGGGGGVASSSLNDLPDNLLEEVVLRLPTAKSAFRCKVFCRRWYFLISDPSFSYRFINTHVNDHHQCGKIICNFRSRDQNVKNSILVIAPFTDPNSNCTEYHSGFSLACLPEEPSRVSVLASCNDLLLCLAPHKNPATGNFDYDNYYICNPFTRQWILLSSHNANKYHFESGTDFGILCDPILSDHNVNYPSTVTVVYVAEMEGNPDYCLSVKKYCPEISRWSESEYLVGEHFQRFSNMVAYRGKFHWFNGDGKIVAYDPLNSGATAFICCAAQLLSAASNSMSANYCLGVCQGSLRVMQLLLNCDDDDDDDNGERYTLRIWELEDYEQGKWVLEHNARFREMVAEISWVQELPSQSYLFPRPLAFHPILKHIVYLRMIMHILSYNMQTTELSPMGKIPPNGRIFNCHLTFPLVLPLWPSPVSVFHNDRNDHP